MQLSLTRAPSLVKKCKQTNTEDYRCLKFFLIEVVRYFANYYFFGPKIYSFKNINTLFVKKTSIFVD